MDRASVDRAILVPPSLEGDRNDYVIEGVCKHPDRFAIMRRVAMPGGSSRQQLKGWRDQRGMLGVRRTFHRGEDRPRLTDGTADWFWGEAEEKGLPVMVHAPERLAVIAEVAARHPALRIIVDHIGFARETMDDAAMAG
jgi:predicted TIM-barrel fold metal-dependent hydrolase